MTSAAMAMVRVFMCHSCPRCSLLKQRQGEILAAGNPCAADLVLGGASAVVHRAVPPTTHHPASVAGVILRAVATTVGGVTAFYLVAWRIAVTLDATVGSQVRPDPGP